MLDDAAPISALTDIALRRRRRTVSPAVMFKTALMGVVSAVLSCAQVPGFALPELPGQLGAFVPSGLTGAPPITTSFADADHALVLPDSFKPTSFEPLQSLPLGPHGGFMLRPGAFQMNVQSYCLHAGTHGPSKGLGYLYAPLLGPEKDVIRALLHASSQHPEIEQHDIQILIWGILARTKVDELPSGARRAATVLLTPPQIFQVNGGALGQVPPEVWQRLLAAAPPPVQSVLAAEAALRDMFRRPGATYADFERIAVPEGILQLTAEDVPAGRWSRHPGGFYVRYFPSSYSKTLLQVYVPPVHADREGANGTWSTVANVIEPIWAQEQQAPTSDPCASAVAEYDPSDDVAVPANTGSQRLSQSARGQDGWVALGLWGCGAPPFGPRGGGPQSPAAPGATGATPPRTTAPGPAPSAGTRPESGGSPANSAAAPSPRPSAGPPDQPPAGPCAETATVTMGASIPVDIHADDLPSFHDQIQQVMGGEAHTQIDLTTSPTVNAKGRIDQVNLVLRMNIIRPRWAGGRASAEDRKLIEKEVEMILAHERRHAEIARASAAAEVCATLGQPAAQAAAIRKKFQGSVDAAQCRLDAQEGLMVVVKNAQGKVVDVRATGTRGSGCPR